MGLWIDHAGATIVRPQGKEWISRQVESGVDRHTRLAGGSRAATVYQAQDVASEGKYERRHRQQLAAYYERLIDTLMDVDELFIFGPGGAKGEFCKALERRKDFGGKIIAVEAADKMTGRQIIAKVRERFSAA
jgi:hypothetical protein